MEARPAATVILARPASTGIEVLVLRRASRSRFAPGFVVFPGGVVEREDAALAGWLFGDTEETARACALRELYEEAGLLLTASGPVLHPARAPLVEVEFAPPPAEVLVDVARWIAPEFLEERFDARFFAVAVPRGLEPVPDGAEIDEAWWEAPASVLAGADRGRTALLWPTSITLQALAACRSVEEVLALHVPQVPRPR